MEKVEVITRHKSGNPKEEKSNITWIEFISFVNPQSENEMYKYAIQLLNGSFIYSTDGYTYFLTGLNLRDDEKV
jgi:hypothetical protein